MRRLFSASRLTESLKARGWPALPVDLLAKVSLWTSVVVVAALFGWGAWQRRWIADDGLIVLRTVRNLLAGNGPVFNAGERIESNTSTVWTYLIYLGGVIGGPVRLEYVALALAFVLSIAGAVMAMLGAARLYNPGVRGRGALFLPAGILVYIAIPPARDFATSGLENGLILAYLGLLWWMMVCWAQAGGNTRPARATLAARAALTVIGVNRRAKADRAGPGRVRAPGAADSTGYQPPALDNMSELARASAARAKAPGDHRGPRRSAVPEVVGPWFAGALAFVAGLSVLVRPELALIGGLALVMMLIAAGGWRRRLLIVAAGGLLPVGYQIFRMGYYGLLVPGTALAKDASGQKWSLGLAYLANFNRPYLLWLPAILLIFLAFLVVRGHTGSRVMPGPRADGRGRLAAAVQSPAAVVVFIVFSGLLQAAYWLRQGGDFMHGRVLLASVFCVLAPVAVIPLVLPDGAELRRRAGWALAGTTAAVWVAVMGWSLWAANSPGLGADATKVTYSGIVDERRFYAQATGHAHPLTALDYLDYPRVRAAIAAIENTPDGALLLPSGNYTQWDVVPANPVDPDYPAPDDPDGPPHTVFFTNLGMLGMTVGLDVRVIDQIGLANPLAGHTTRLEDGRIGHDKNLFPDWAVADGPWLKEERYLPPYLDEDWVTRAEVALTCPATESVLNSVRGPLTFRRFLSNIVHSPHFTSYRIDRVPEYELIRCDLSEPELRGTPYSGLPATGP